MLPQSNVIFIFSLLIIYLIVFFVFQLYFSSDENSMLRQINRETRERKIRPKLAGTTAKALLKNSAVEFIFRM